MANFSSESSKPKPKWLGRRMKVKLTFLFECFFVPGCLFILILDGFVLSVFIGQHGKILKLQLQAF